MNKPDDIPQDVWDVAWSYVNDAEVEKLPYYAMPDEFDFARKEDAVKIARAIMAGKAEEREACAVVADANMNDGPLDAATAIQARNNPKTTAP